MEEQMRQGLREHFRMTDEDIDLLLSSPFGVKLVTSMPELMQYKIIAEVQESKYCSAGLEAGQKFTISAMPAVFLPEESSCAPCINALGPIANITRGIWEKIMNGGDPSEAQKVECLDPGIAQGGLGHVLFKVYAEKKPD